MQIHTYTRRRSSPRSSLRRTSRTALIALGAALGLITGAACGAEKAGEVIFVIGGVGWLIYVKPVPDACGNLKSIVNAWGMP